MEPPAMPRVPGGLTREAREPRPDLRLGTSPRPPERAVRCRRLATAVPPRPRGESVPGADRNYPFTADEGCEHRRGQRPPLRPIPGCGVAGACASRGGRAAHSGDRVLSGQGPGRGPGRASCPREIRRHGASGLRCVGVASRRGAEDRELRAGVRLRHPRDSRRHPRAPDREPTRSRPYEAPRRDRSGPARARGRPLLDPAEPSSRPARTERVSPKPAPVSRVSDRRPVRYGPSPHRRSGPAATGGPAGPAEVAGRRRRARRVTTVSPTSVSQPTE